MLALIGYALILVAVVAVLFVLAVFEAASIEVKRRGAITYLRPDESHDDEKSDSDLELTRAA